MKSALRMPFLLIMLCVLAATAACGKSSPSPTSPGAAGVASGNANADGSLLKATAPTPQSPINGVKITQGTLVTLVITNSATPYTNAVQLVYRFEVANTAGVIAESVVVPSGPGTTSHVVTAALEGDKTYQWQARAEYLGIAGPWSSPASFIAPANDGYIRGTELYDPLINGKTVGVANDVTFVPGVGVQLNSQSSFIAYQLGGTLTAGEFSLLTTNVVQASMGRKSKVFSMSINSGEMSHDPRRFTIEKRGDSEAGAIAWKILTSGGFVETNSPAQRLVVNFTASNTYFWRATWGTDFRLIINDGGINGANIYDFGKTLPGVYDPNPHWVFLGSPPNLNGPDSQSLPGVIIRQVWVSDRPRPDFANQ